ncbi:SVM family protein ['Planchonia careya' phytoplasma]|nr:SVM family protein ['Planchonia careya' phytoplasma]MDO8030255.1 SVM family protein ['Planchonia careya' phytoplasma]
MFKLQNQFKIISICLFIFLGLLFAMNNNQVMASSKKHGKDIISPKEESKQNVKKYFELYNTLENYSEEDRNKIIQMLSNPEIIKILKEEAKSANTQQKGSSSKKTDNSEK